VSQNERVREQYRSNEQACDALERVESNSGAAEYKKSKKRYKERCQQCILEKRFLEQVFDSFFTKRKNSKRQ